MIGDHPLTPWEKLSIIFLGGGVVSFTLLLVVCFVCPTCLIFKTFNRGVLRRQKRKITNGKPGSLMSTSASTSKLRPLCSKSDHPLSDFECEDPKKKIYYNGDTHAGNGRSKSMETLISRRSEADRYSSRKATRDSTYGSLASTSSGRTSPSTMSVGSWSTFSFGSNRSGTDPGSKPVMMVKMAFKVDKNCKDQQQASEKYQLTTTLKNVNDIPRRSYSTSRDPFAILSIYQEKTSSLTRKSKVVLFEEKTKIVRRTLNPAYNFSCAIKEIEDIKNVKVKVVIYDYDKNTKVSEIGSAVIALKTLKSALLESNTTEATEVSLGAKMPAKLDLGSIELGLSYLPTAQRMSFSIIKASQLRFDKCNVTNLEDFEPFVRVIQVNPSGRVLRKKRTQIQSATKEPLFNETLNFEVSPSEVENMTFIVMVSTRLTSSNSLSDSHSGSESQEMEKCLGFTSFGKNVSLERERAHWYSVITSPRKVFTGTFKIE